MPGIGSTPKSTPSDKEGDVFRAIVFWVKTWCDMYLYGYVLVPSRNCHICGVEIQPGELVSGKIHAACLPKWQERVERQENK